jgi:DNA modification methylase
MPAELAAFFIEFLTEPGDLVFDPFAGSNTTGYVAEKLGRRWVSIEANYEYALQSRIRFADPSLHKFLR